MEIRDLQIFQAVAEHNSISKAAVNLNYVQSNVTARIQMLEKELGTKLFHRHKKGMVLTAEGKRLLTHSQKVLTEWAEIKNLFLDSENPSGTLTIGTVEIVSQLPYILSSYFTKFPNVDLSLKAGVTEELLTEVLHYQLEGAFITGPIQHHLLEQYPVFEEELTLVTNSPQFEKTQLVNQTLLVLNKGCGYRLKLENWLKAEGVSPRRVIEFSTLDMIIKSVTLGLGITAVPKSYIEQLSDYKNLYCHQIPEEFQTIVTLFIRKKDTYMTNSVKQLLNIILEKKELLVREDNRVNSELAGL